MPSPDTGGPCRTPCSTAGSDGMRGAMRGRPLWLPALAVRSLRPGPYYVCVVARETPLLNWDQRGGGLTFSFCTQSINYDPLREEAARYRAVGNVEPL